MKGVYIYEFPYSDEISSSSVGIMKKVYSQYEVLREELTTDFALKNVYGKKVYNKVLLFFCHLFFKKTYDFSFTEDDNYDYVYIRRLIPNNRSLLYNLQQIKMKNTACKIVYEIPTYPYDEECNGLSGKLLLFIDKIYRKKLYKYVDRIATLTDDKEIFGCKTLKISNGVDCSSIPICKKENFDKNHINLIAVAQFSFWHGYERVIEGLSKYINNDVFLHLVGNGEELEKYKSLVKKYGLENKVIFYGPLSGDELTAVFDIADVALCSLACHKKNIKLSAELKSREYLCRGLPIITSTKIDILSDDFKYCYRVSEDDSPIDIEEVVDYVNGLYKDGRSFVAKEVRTFAEENCSMGKAIKSVKEFFL